LVVNNTENYTIQFSVVFVDIEEEPKMPLDILISNTGGNFGLFLGISILSLVEFVEILFQVLYITLKKYKNNKRKKN